VWARLRLAQTAVLTLERERVRSQADLAVAANVQRGLLPAPSDGITWFAAMQPAGLVGGDYYDFFEDLDRRMWLLVADVSGKGVPAAVFVSNARAVVRAVARERVSPARLLGSVSDILRADGRGDLYVTCFAAMVDPARRTMMYANAGHPPGLVIRRERGTHGGVGRSVRALSAGGPPLGLVRDARYQEETVELSGGDLVVVVSDGITDALNASGEDIPRLLSAAVGGAKTPREACHALLAAAARGPGPEGALAWADDRTVLAFRVALAAEPVGSPPPAVLWRRQGLPGRRSGKTSTAVGQAEPDDPERSFASRLRRFNPPFRSGSRAYRPMRWG
jgi:phosphoserine phosphatase RsbU/P